MHTIVEYTRHKAPENLFPKRIISPPRASECCFRDMEAVGTPQRDGQWAFQYPRCRTCGFTVRAILRYIPDTALLGDLSCILAHSRSVAHPATLKRRSE